MMSSKPGRLAGAAFLLYVTCQAALAEQGKLFRWVDDEGVVHYADSIPPEYAKLERQVLNHQGVQLETLAGEKTPEELEAERLRQQQREQEQEREKQAGLRDQILLSTYLSVDEIEHLRDRRMELMDGHIRVTEIYLKNLRAKLLKLQREAEPYRPYNVDPDAPPIDDKLARELSDTLDSIILYEKNLAAARTQQMASVARFAADIERFKALKGEARSN